MGRHNFSSTGIPVSLTGITVNETGIITSILPGRQNSGTPSNSWSATWLTNKADKFKYDPLWQWANKHHYSEKKFHAYWGWLLIRRRCHSILHYISWLCQNRHRCSYLLTREIFEVFANDKLKVFLHNKFRPPYRKMCLKFTFSCLPILFLCLVGVTQLLLKKLQCIS